MKFLFITVLSLLPTLGISDSIPSSELVGNFRRIEQQYRAEVVEGVYSSIEPSLLETNYSAIAPPANLTIIIDNVNVNVSLPVYNTTIAFRLPFAVERTLGLAVRRLYLDDPMGFRMRARRRAERRERYRDLIDFVNDLDDRTTVTSATTTAIPTALQERIDRVLSSVDSRVSRAAGSRTEERRAFATSVMKSLISDAMVSNLPTLTTSTATPASRSVTYQTVTTSYSAMGGVEAFVTSYLVLQAVEASTTRTSVTGSASLQSGATTPATPTTTTNTGGAGIFDLKAAATLGLVGLVIQAAL